MNSDKVGRFFETACSLGWMMRWWKSAVMQQVCLLELVKHVVGSGCTVHDRRPPPTHHARPACRLLDPFQRYSRSKSRVVRNL